MTKVLLQTTKGDITLQLYPEVAPLTVENFVNYVKAGYYTDTIFHRVIKGFMIQGGGMTQALERKPGQFPELKNEAHLNPGKLANNKYTVAMARTQLVDSATSQFFINTADNDFLNHREATPAGYGYCVFGEVVDGFAVVDAIEAVKTGTMYYYQDVPKETITITGAQVLED